MPPKKTRTNSLAERLVLHDFFKLGHTCGISVRKNYGMYIVRRMKLQPSRQLDDLSLTAGALYSRTVTCFWRGVRKGTWLSPWSLMRWQPERRLHAHSADAVVQTFFGALNSWRRRRRTDPSARPPHRRRRFMAVQWKSSAIRVRRGELILSNGKVTPALTIPWPFETPVFVEIGWAGNAYELRAAYKAEAVSSPIGNRIAGMDLGEVHIAASHDGEESIIVNGRYLRSKRRYQNKVKGALSAALDRKKRGSRRWKRLKRSKQKQLQRLRHQIDDVLHKQTSALVSALHESGVQTIAIGDVRNIRRRTNFGKKANQRLHQWSAGKVRWMITYKAARLGIAVELVNEHYTSQVCPACGRYYKPQGRVYRCRYCSRAFHRDLVGAHNMRAKYRGNWAFPVVGVHPPQGGMASPSGLRFYPHRRCSSPDAARKVRRAMDVRQPLLAKPAGSGKIKWR